MMVRAQVGNGPNVGVLVLLIRLLLGFFVLFGDIVDSRLVPFAIGVDHQSSVTATRVTFSLHMPLFLTVAAHDIGVASVVASRGCISQGSLWSRLVIVLWLLLSNSHKLVEFLVGQFIPKDNVGLSGRH
jgi:hypothetical protein